MWNARATARGLLSCLLMFGALARAEDRPMPGGMPPNGQQMDCDQLASMPGAPMSVEDCKKMMGSMQAGKPGAGSSAARPGDEAMTCEQIAAEMSTMKGVGLSEKQQKENAAAAEQHQALLAKQQAEITAIGVAGSAAVTSAAAADAATELATGGIVRGKSAAAAQEAVQATAKVAGERMAAERKPSEQRLSSAVGASTRAMADSMQSNPRFSRLIQLAIAKDCKE